MLKEINKKNISFDEINKIIRSLSTNNKIKLVKQIATQIETDLKKNHQPIYKSLCGIWKGINITDEDITNVRHEMWDNIPSKDIQ